MPPVPAPPPAPPPIAITVIAASTAPTAATAAHAAISRLPTAIPHIPAFTEALESADVEPARLILLSKPSPRPTTKAALDTYATQTRTLHIPASLQLNTRTAQRPLAD